jgi:alcohol dehydrogenase class IV
MSQFRTQLGLRGVVSGVGCVQAELADSLKSQGVSRPMIVCGANVGRSPVMDLVGDGLEATPLVFSGSQPHTPVETVDQGASVARAAGGQMDGLIAVGGSSAVDCAKGIAVLLATGHTHVAELTPASFGRLGDPFDATGALPFPLLMVTTTLSFAEFLPFWGVRKDGRKVAYPDYGRVMRTVFLDGAVAAHTPDSVWAETGVKALDDAIAAFCRSAGPEPFIDPILIRAIGDLVDQLPQSGGAAAGDVRQDVLTSTWMTKFPLPRLGPVTTTGWFSTAARHALGGVLALPHGVGSCVSLIEGLRFHRATTGGRQALLASALGWGGADEALSSGLAELLVTLGVPTNLRQCGISAGDLLPVAEHMLAESPQLGSLDSILSACERIC